MNCRDILSNRNYLLGITWFIVMWLVASLVTRLIGDNLRDEYMGTVVEIGLGIFMFGVVVSFIIDKYKKKFALGFLSALVVVLFVMFLTSVINNF